MRNVILKATNLTKIYGTASQLTAELKDGSEPLIGKNIIFSIHGVDYTRVTDGSGTAKLNINLNIGSYPCSIRFLGDSVYNSARVDVVVRVVSNNSVTQTTERTANGNYFEVNKIPLHVIMSSGFDVDSGANIKETQLLHDDGTYNTPIFYFNSGFDGDDFEVSVVMKKSYYHEGRTVMSLLEEWNKLNTPVSVVTDAMVVPNGKYTVQIKKKSQTLERRSIWKLRFKQYFENSWSFESMYDLKLPTLSALDELLLTQINGINNKSPVAAIKALQMKLNSLGLGPGYVTQYYEGYISTALFRFQCDYMDTTSKLGVCDFDTIRALISYSYGGL